MARRRAFTLIELLVVISIIVLLLALLLPALMGARRSARQQQNAARMKSLGDGMKRFSDGNRGFFPGLDAQGNVTLTANIALSGRNGDYPEARMAILFHGSFIEPKDAINPIDSAVTPYKPAPNQFINVGNYSYAMLQFDNTSSQAGQQYGRKFAWSSDVNPEAPLMCDRNTGANANAGTQPGVSSVWEEFEGGFWTGNVAWGDLSVKYENTHTINTKYPGLVNNAGFPDDNLFIRSHLSDAAMVYKTNSDYLRQRP